MIKENLKEIAKLITLEQGKTLPDAEGDVMRGLQVVEQCCSLTNLLLGETLPGITKVNKIKIKHIFPLREDEAVFVRLKRVSIVRGLYRARVIFYLVTIAAVHEV